MGKYRGRIAQHINRYDSHQVNGITAKTAEYALDTFGENILDTRPKTGFAAGLWAEIKNPVMAGTAGACLLAIVLEILVGGIGLALPVFTMLLVLVYAGWVSGLKLLEESVSARLEEFCTPYAKVIRDGGETKIPAAQLVPGDIVLIGAGDLILADGRLVESQGLSCQEFLLTGESAPSSKDHEALVAGGTPPGERANMVYSGSYVVSGRGRFLVTATGGSTEFARLPKSHREEESGRYSPRWLEGYLGWSQMAGLLACGVSVMAGALWGIEPFSILLSGLVIAATSLPGRFFTVSRLTLVRGSLQMADAGAIVRGGGSLERLGRISVVLAEKQREITTGKLSVRRLWPIGGRMEEPDGELSEECIHLLRLACLCCEGRVEVRGERLKQIGDPGETAILACAFEHGIYRSELESDYPRVAMASESGQAGAAFSIHEVGKSLLVIAKGQPEALLPFCKNSDNPRALRIIESIRGLSMRVVALACRELDSLPQGEEGQSLPDELTLIGLIGIFDPPSKEGMAAPAEGRRAGVRTVMFTDEHPDTARAIAEELEILQQGEEILTGSELELIDQAELVRKVPDYSVFSRLNEGDKLRVAAAWQERGERPAIVGRGVQDAEILREAYFGVAPQSGTHIAKDSARLILKSPRLEEILKAVAGARQLLVRVDGTLEFMAGCALCRGMIFLIAALLGLGLPINGVQVILLVLLAEGLPILAAGRSKLGNNLTAKPPEGGANWFRIILLAQILALCITTLWGYSLGAGTLLSLHLQPSPQVGVSMAFPILFLGQLGLGSSSLGNRTELSSTGFLRYKRAARGLIFWVGIFALVLSTPLNRLVGVYPISILHWMIVLGLGLLPTLIGEIARGTVYTVGG